MIKRIKWIDTLRGIGMFFVIFGHAFVNKKNIIRKYIYSFHMPLFFFISGLTTKRSDIKVLPFIKKKMKSLLLPYLFINVFVLLFKYITSFLFDLYKNIDLIGGIEFFFKGYSNKLPCIQSWFLLCLFIIEIMFYLLTRVFKDDIKLSISIVLIFILGILYSRSNYTFLVYFHLDTSLIGLLFYHLGYLFMKHIKVFEKFITSYYSIILVIILLMGGYILQDNNIKISMNANHYGNVLIFLSSTIFTIFSIIIFVNTVLNKSKFFSGVGVNSIFFLGYHGFVLALFKKYISFSLSNDIMTFVTSIVTLLVMYPFAILTMKKFPILVGKIKK
ncbi:MAG: acyltransferase family protein [Bacilli bacterium]|nr:acyltransferase family protein [Bacilli bacterium]